MNQATFEPYKLIKTAISCNAIIACFGFSFIFLLFLFIFCVGTFIAILLTTFVNLIHFAKIPKETNFKNYNNASASLVRVLILVNIIMCDCYSFRDETQSKSKTQ